MQKVNEVRWALVGRTMVFGVYDRGKWRRLFIEKGLAVEIECTHYLPEPEPPKESQ